MNIALDSRLASLIGFGYKSRQIFTGFEAVRRAMNKKGNVALILVDTELSDNSFKKIRTMAERTGIPLCRVKKSEEGYDLIQLLGYKIVAIQEGDLAQGFIKKLKQESQWQ